MFYFFKEVNSFCNISLVFIKVLCREVMRDKVELVFIRLVEI